MSSVFCSKMRTITDLRQLKGQFKKPVVTIGIFDGVHIGHRRIIRKVVEEAKRINGTSVVVTFDPHPARLLDIIGAPPLLVSVRHRLSLIEAEGVDLAVVVNFSKAFASHTAEGFIKKILVSKIDAHSVIIGTGFRFGKKQRGSIKLLRSFGKKYGFFANEVRLFKHRAKAVSSTRIRSLITKGKLVESSRLLGRPVSVLGTVMRGSRRGRLLGYPTANINPHHEAIPPSGVYAVYAMHKGKRYKGILNIGVRPTFHGRHEVDCEPTIEVHLINFNNKIYGQDIEVIFVRKIRDEKRFKTKEGLIKQIKIDEHRANMVLY